MDWKTIAFVISMPKLEVLENQTQVARSGTLVAESNLTWIKRFLNEKAFTKFLVIPNKKVVIKMKQVTHFAVSEIIILKQKVAQLFAQLLSIEG